MRRLPWLVLGLAACSSSPPTTVPPSEKPRVAVVRALPAGTRLFIDLAPGIPDEPLFRAARVWWREALLQTGTFDVAEARPPRNARVLELGIDPVGRRLSALFREPGAASLALAGDSYAEDHLAEGIDRIAWAARLALGEDAPPPVPVAAATSLVPRTVDAASDGFQLLRDGGPESARRAFATARRFDGASPFVLDGLASAALLRGDAGAAARICGEALTYEHRLTPRRRLRLQRTLLLARAGLQPELTPELDRALLTLGQQALDVRPHDAEGLLTVAIAENFLGEFAAARPRLQVLAARSPEDAIVSYHLGWACLGTGDPVAAGAAFADAAVRLGKAWVTIPRAIALHEASDTEGLERLLGSLLRDLAPTEAALRHELLRMSAAHALLRGDRDAAAARIIEDFNWLVANPTLLDVRPGEFAAQGEVLVRLGRRDGLPPVLAAIQGQHPASAIADACAFLSGMLEVARREQRALDLEQRLSLGGESAFALRLQAFAHEVRGELADGHAALARAARLDDSALTKALLARSLRMTGREGEAQALRAALRRELTAIHLRRRPSHPLLGPELALAYLME